MITNLKYLDVWRQCNLDKKEYTYYSNKYNMYSKLDYILVSQELLGNLSSAHHCPKILADHLSVYATLEIEGEKENSYS